MSTPFSILDIGRRINSLSVAYCDLDDDPDIQQPEEHRPDPVQFKIRRCVSCTVPFVRWYRSAMSTRLFIAWRKFADHLDPPRWVSLQGSTKTSPGVVCRNAQREKAAPLGERRYFSTIPR